MLVVGLTGGIGCGKSTVSTKLSKDFKIPVIDADKIARQVVQPGEKAYEAIVLHFRGKIPELIDSTNGNLNRAALGQWAFSHPEDLKQLNRITHPAIRYEIFKQIITCYLKGYKMCILDVPLLFESSLDTFCGVSISVVCDEETQIRRLTQRNPTMSTEEAKNRIKSQMQIGERIARSDYVIENNLDLPALYAQVENVVHQIKPNFARYALEYFPPFGCVSAAAVILIKSFRKRAMGDRQIKSSNN
ncbi:LAMI_0H18844g1_1 [Lachancea mirantina]|uniref:LAMI_0H18844g1_1 n=1 Tax=Lachancea mirantina TaxID=1230905 RepID=A0A1G4KJP8_9SACH|nr:LAMI_0H18844g1_1 [Lachancea mirantina]